MTNADGPPGQCPLGKDEWTNDGGRFWRSLMANCPIVALATDVHVDRRAHMTCDDGRQGESPVGNAEITMDGGRWEDSLLSTPGTITKSKSHPRLDARYNYGNCTLYYHTRTQPRKMVRSQAPR